MKKAVKTKEKLGPENNRKKVGIILFVASIVVVVLLVVRFSLIVATGKVAGVSLNEKTQQLYQGSSVVKAKRGSIYDRNGNPIAEDATSYSLYAVLDKEYIGVGKEKLYVQDQNKNDIADILNKNIANLEKSYILEQLNQTKNADGMDIKRVEFGVEGKNINLATKNEIEKEYDEKGIKGIYFDEHPARIYPNGVFSSHLIGYADLVDREDESKGLEGVLGIEAAYNEELSGQDGKIHYRKDKYGNPLPGTIVEEKETKEGENIYTTLDVNLQLYLEDLMSQVDEKYKPENLTAMLVEADTGAIVAASQRPSFNPETKEGLNKEDSLWRDLLVEEPFEPGSTFKVFTVAAAVDQGLFPENATFQSGSIKVGDSTINDHDVSTNGSRTLTYRQALSWSSNVGMVHLEQDMDDNHNNSWQEYIQKFGFTKSTNSRLPNEQTGAVQNGTVDDKASTSFGQGISVTDFQMVQGYTALANQGSMLKPQYISKMEDPSTGKITEVTPEVVGQPIQPETAKKVLEYMQDTVESRDYGTGFGTYNLEGYSVSAKTGTAQLFIDGQYTTSDYNYIYSVAEVAPTENPKYIMYVTMKIPHDNPDEVLPSKMLAQISNPLLKRALEMEQVSTGTEEKQQDKIVLPDFSNNSVSQAKQTAESLGLDIVLVGNGDKIVKQSTKVGESILKNEKLILLTDGEKTMPDILGWSKKDVLKLADISSLTAEFEGQGYVKSQSISPEQEFKDGDVLKVILAQN